MEGMGEVAAEGLGAGAIPEGTVTFLFTDLEGSTRLLEAHPAAYRGPCAGTTPSCGRRWRGTGGRCSRRWGTRSTPPSPPPRTPWPAAIAGQLALQREDWGVVGAGALRARMGLHTGEVVAQGGHYFGAPLLPRRAARWRRPTGGRWCSRGRPPSSSQTPCRPRRPCTTWASTGSGTWRGPCGSFSSVTPTSRPSSRRCARSTRSRTTCPCSSPASSVASASRRTCGGSWTRPGC